MANPGRGNGDNVQGDEAHQQPILREEFDVLKRDVRDLIQTLQTLTIEMRGRGRDMKEPDHIPPVDPYFGRRGPIN